MAAALLDALSWLPERVATAARRGRPDEFARYLEDLASVTVDILSSASHPGKGGPLGNGPKSGTSLAGHGGGSGSSALHVRGRQHPDERQVPVLVVEVQPVADHEGVRDHESAVIRLHLHLLPETEKLINKEKLAKMKKGTMLVNTSRGEIVDEGAVLEALEDALRA